MQQTTPHAGQQTRWTHRKPLERQSGLPRGMLLSKAVCSDSMLERVLAATHLDSTTLDQFTRILAVTVRDWVRK